MTKILPLIFLIASHLFVSGVTSKKYITIENNCDYTVWPAIFNYGNQLSNITGSFALEKGESLVIRAPSFWEGKIWGRTLCARNPTTGNFSCATGDCGSAEIGCSGKDVWNTTLAEFKMNNDSGDLYRVNVVYGYNLPLLVVPHSRVYVNRKACSMVGCDVVDLNQACPYELMIVDAEERPIACTNQCQTQTPDCMTSSYAQSFKVPCPEATIVDDYDDDNDNYLICTSSTDYVITFCPSFTPILESEEQQKKKDGSGTKVNLNVRLNHQFKFGEHVSVFGLAKEIGSWKKKSPLTWTENGWVCEIELSETSLGAALLNL